LVTGAFVLDAAALLPLVPLAAAVLAFDLRFTEVGLSGLACTAFFTAVGAALAGWLTLAGGAATLAVVAIFF